MRRKPLPPPRRGPLLRVATLNTWGLPFPLAWRSRTTRFPRIDAFLHGHGFDLVGLQEVWKGAGRLLPSHDLHTHPEGDSGLAIVSRLPADEAPSLTFRRSSGPDSFKQKGVLARRVWAGEAPAWFVVTHLQAGRGRRAVDVRASQVDELLGLLGRLAGAAIVVGDFNFHADREPDHRSHAALEAAGLRDAAHHVGDAPDPGRTDDHHPEAVAPTHPLTGQRFDRVYLRDGGGIALDAEYVRVWGARAAVALSDHAPVEAGVRVLHPDDAEAAPDPPR